MEKCRNSETFGQGHIVFCGEPIYGPGSEIFICREHLKKKLAEFTETWKIFHDSLDIGDGDYDFESFKKLNELAGIEQ